MPLSKVFLDCLLSGHLSELCNFLKFDATLSPEIRKDTLSVYYRGGRLLSIQWNGKDYQAIFDPQYFKNELADAPAFAKWRQQAALLPEVLNSTDDVTLCIAAIPSLKSTMDLWFGSHRPLERESVQRLIRDNNQDVATGTDYFICDVECVQRLADGSDARFDFIGVHWESVAHKKKNPRNLELVFGEAKYGPGAINGSAGLLAHMHDVAALVNDRNALDRLKERMKQIFDQKLKLGLIDNKNAIESFADTKPIWLLVIANHDPESSMLGEALEEIAAVPDFPATIKIAVANFMGYGLFDQAIYELTEFRSHFGKHIRA